MPDRAAEDPYGVFNFVVEIDHAEIGGFSEVTGLQVETETETYREGGNNLYEHKLAKITKYSNLVLKRGIIDSVQLWKMHQDVINGRIEKSSVTVILRDNAKKEKWRWAFKDAYPVKWSATDLNATSSTVVVETLEFAHNGIQKI
jgi:phage tail-like protein